jgi:hypothetical protein
MSRIADRIGCRYDDILAYFKIVPFGCNPPDMTALSNLPPVDRCLILEKVLINADGDILTLIDKLSMAYLKAGWMDLAIAFVRASCRRGLIDTYALAYFEGKMDRLSGVRMSSSSYEESIPRIQRDMWMAPDMCELLIDLCEGYRGHDVFEGIDFLNPLHAPDVRQFIEERRNFIRRIAGVR